MKCLIFSSCAILVVFCSFSLGEKEKLKQEGSLIDSVILGLLPKKIGYDGELRSRLFNKNFSMYAELRDKRSPDLRMQGLVSLNSPLKLKMKGLNQKLALNSLGDKLKYDMDLGVGGAIAPLSHDNDDGGSLKTNKIDIQLMSDTTPDASSTSNNIVKSTVERSSNDRVLNETHGLKPFKLINELSASTKSDVSNSPSSVKLDEMSRSTQLMDPSSKQMSKNTEMDRSLSTPMVVDKGTSSHSVTAFKNSPKFDFGKSSHGVTSEATTKLPEVSITQFPSTMNFTTHKPTDHVVTTMKPPTSVSKPPSNSTAVHSEPTTKATIPPSKTTSALPTSSTPKMGITTEKPPSSKRTEKPTTLSTSSPMTTAKVNLTTTKPTNSTKLKKSLGTTVSPLTILTLFIPIIISYL